MIFPNESILDPDNGPSGFATPDFTMAAVPVIGTGEYCIIAFGTQHEYCKDRKTAEIKLEQLWKATRKGAKGTKTPVQPKSKKKAKTAPGQQGSQGSKPKATKTAPTKPKSKVPAREDPKTPAPIQDKKIPNGKTRPVKKPSTLHPNPLLDALS